ncbi:hypothetical protein HN865_03490 [Candidatus Woesearchaeota archaeon]|jgi:hypothetical protein|nr:hypothetical protein [Candidatus Woesearchaeota archaeon]MBT7237895.1 hypothetical protein [Candidatus Woesearchaeota archaeon]
MVKEHNEKSAFGKALVLTVILFLVGVSLGVFIESYRSNSIKDQYEELEFELLDSKLRTNFYQLMGEDFCDIAVEDNLAFSDRIYEEGKKIEVYAKFNRLGDKLIEEKKKYTLLKTEFWLNSILLRDKCNEDYETVVYFYLDDPQEDNIKQSQNVQSRILGDLKEKYGSEIMLIPLPTDLDVSVVNAFVELNDITMFPTILINEEIKLEGLHNLEDIEKLI